MTNFSYNPDQFGYYTVGPTFKTYSKILAIEEQRKTGHFPQWHFNKQTYGIYDWTKEPKESIKELYRRRAQEIRDQYDYVVIWYSGGPDSWCVLNSFLENDIKVDEIAQFISYEADNDRHSYLNEEVFYTSIPQTQKIVEQRPDIKHRVVDISKLILDTYLKPDVRFDFVYNLKGIASANSLARSYMRDDIEDYRKIMDSGRRLCFVWGAEKPRVITVNGRYHAMFIDAFSDTNIRIQGLADQGYFDEWFFWGPNSAALVAKQCHMLKRVLETERPGSPWLESTSSLNHLPRSRQTGLYIKDDRYHTLIYPGWDPATLVAPKPTNLFVSSRDDWFWNSSKDHLPSLKYALGGIRTYVKKLGSEWLNDPKDPAKGIKGCINLYALE